LQQNSTWLPGNEALSNLIPTTAARTYNIFPVGKYQKSLDIIYV
jgi:hypothetical protein